MKTQSQEELRPQVLAKMAFGHSSAITAWNREPTKTNYHTPQLTPSKINAPSLESATKLPIHNLGRNKRRPIYGPSTANSHSPPSFPIALQTSWNKNKPHSDRPLRYIWRWWPSEGSRHFWRAKTCTFCCSTPQRPTLLLREKRRGARQVNRKICTGIWTSTEKNRTGKNNLHK